MEWVILTVGALIIMLLILALVFRDKNHRTDYHAFFIMGIIWLIIGIPLALSSESPTLFIMGLIFTAVGLIHHKDWKKNIKERKNHWNKMSKKEKKRLMLFRWIMLALLLIGLIVLAVFYFFAKGA